MAAGVKIPNAKRAKAKEISTINSQFISELWEFFVIWSFGV
jgi:hypothetical protein